MKHQYRHQCVQCGQATQLINSSKAATAQLAARRSNRRMVSSMLSRRIFCLTAILIPWPRASSAGHFHFNGVRNPQNQKKLCNYYWNVWNFTKTYFCIVLNWFYKAKLGLGIARGMPETIRTRCYEFWDHLTLPNIGNPTIHFQSSIQCTTIGPQNLPFRPGLAQEICFSLASIYHTHIFCK